jgi:hypothetical protein
VRPFLSVDLLPNERTNTPLFQTAKSPLCTVGVAQKHGRIHMHTTAEVRITQNTHEDNKLPLPQSIRQRLKGGEKKTFHYLGKAYINP